MSPLYTSTTYYWRKCNVRGKSFPEARYGHSANLLDNRLFIFAGWHRKDSTSFSDLWELNLDNMEWTKPQVTGDLPPPRGGHTAIMVNSRYLYVFGGQNRTTIFNDLCILDIETMRWTRHLFNSEKDTDIPEPRSQHIAIRIENQMIVCLGHDGYGKMFNNAFALNTETLQWTRLETNGTAPCAVGGAASTLIGNKLFVFGGRHHPHKYSNSLHILDLETLEWSEPETKGETVPTPRAAHSATLVGSEILIFGGSNGKDRLSDLFILDPDTLEWRCPMVSGTVPGAHSVHSATVVGPYVFVYGGFNGTECYNQTYVLDTEECPGR